jgi:Leucine-rich repeat (LRR) protein
MNTNSQYIHALTDSNNLQSTPPSELVAIESLEVLSAFSNNLTGTLPAFSNWPNLKFIDVENNQLIGPAFPATLALLTALEVYRVSNNKLTGELATAPFLQLQRLRELWIAANQIVGSIPTTISSAAGLGT